jgi:hypothetical protein
MFYWRALLSANFFILGFLTMHVLLKSPTLISLSFVLFLSGSVFGQKQLVVLKRENVLLRLYPGDEFVYRLKGEKIVRTTYVNNIFPTAVLTHRDTVPFNAIDRVYFRQRKLYNTLGGALVIFGAGLFIVDQLNVTVVNGNKPSLDDDVTTLSVSSLAVGLPLMLIKKKSQRIRYPTRLMLIDRNSGFYRPDTREQVN